eukprot:g2581.t1
MSTENEEKQQDPQPEGEAIMSMVTQPLPVAEGEARGYEGGGYDRVKPPQLFSGATEEDGAKAQEHCLGYNDVATAVWRVNPENHNVAIKQAAIVLAIPCFWPHAIICSPCLFAMNSAAKGFLKGTLYILGKKNLYRLVEVHADSGGCAVCATGKDSGFEKLSALSSVAVDNPGALPCAQVSAVKVGVPFGSALGPQSSGMHVSNAGNVRVVAPTFQMLVSEPDTAAQLIHQAMENAQKTQSQEAPPQMQMQAQAAASPKSKKDQLKELTEMRGEGLITENEFQEKREKILSSYS